MVRPVRTERAHHRRKLIEGVENAEKGLIDANYGGGVIKQRISRPCEGKSGGYRSIILFRKGALAFFVFGFAKGDQGKIDERDFKELAKVLLPLSEAELKELTDSGKYAEVEYEETDETVDEENGEKDDK